MTVPADPNLELRPAGSADVAAVVTLADSAYRGESSRAGWTTEADLLGGIRTDADAVAALIADPAGVVLVADLEPGVALACCHLRDRGEGVTSLGLLAVSPARQGAGLGRAVLDAAGVEAARRFGARHLRITVIAQRVDLIAWYERVGFVSTGETEPFPYGDERYGIPKRPDLVFTVMVRPLPDA